MVTGLKNRAVSILTMRHGEHPPHPTIYITCQWQKQGGVNLLYLWYRWFVAVFALSVALASFLAPERGTHPLPGADPEPIVHWKWFIYLTNWGYTLVVAHTIISLIKLQTAFIERKTKEQRDENMFTDVELSLTTVKENLAELEDDSAYQSQSPCTSERCLGTVSRVIHAAATDLAFLITTVYWSLIYDPKIHVIDAINLLVHGFNSLIMLTELCLVRHISLPLDAIGALAVALFYAIFSAIYYVSGGTDRHGRSFIYPALDWSQIGRSFIFCTGCAGGILAAHVLMLVIQAARRALHNKVENRNSS